MFAVRFKVPITWIPPPVIRGTECTYKVQLRTFNWKHFSLAKWYISKLGWAYTRETALNSQVHQDT